MSVSLNGQVIQKLYGIICDFLQARYNGKIFTLSALSIEPGSALGENYLSCIFKVKFTCKANENEPEFFDLIFKSQLIKNEVQADIGAKFFWNIMFMKEKMIYSDIITKLVDLNGGKNMGPNLLHFYSEEEEYSCLLLDNLISLGYEIPKSEGDALSIENANLIVRALACFHALSLVLEHGEDQQPIPEKYEFCSEKAEMMFSPMLDTMKSFINNSYLGVIKLAEKFRPDIVSRLQRIHQEKSVWERLVSFTRPNVSSFNCLCHGDARLNNIFIKNGVVKFIDFQLVRYTSPITDILYLLYFGATRKSSRKKSIKEILSNYYEEFRKVLNNHPQVSFPRAIQDFNFQKLEEEYETMKLFGFLIAMTFLPLVLNHSGDVEKSTTEMSDQERDAFMNDRAELILRMGTNFQPLRERIFETCDEMIEGNVI